MPRKTCKADHRVKCSKCPVMHDSGRALCDECYEKDKKENPKKYTVKRVLYNPRDLIHKAVNIVPPPLRGFLSQFDKKG